MKKLAILPLLVLVITGITRCKKNNTANNCEQVTVTTIAGSGAEGFLDTIAAMAKFKTPWDIAVHPNGDLYVTDMDNYRIRKISANGQVTTWAGNGHPRVLDGNGTEAEFRSPEMIALDVAGNAYVTSLLDARLRKITTNADVSVYAGLATPGFADGPVSIAQFKPCWGVIVDAQGNVILGDAINQRVRKIDTSGQVTTLAGSGDAGFADSAAALAKFNYPLGITIDKQGNLYVADFNNLRIRMITPGGVVSTIAGSGKRGIKDGKAAQAEFYELHDLVADSQGNLYATDANRIRKITPAGEVITIAGSEQKGFADGPGIVARFNRPQGLGIDATGNIYVADTYNRRIRKISFE